MARNRASTSLAFLLSLVFLVGILAASTPLPARADEPPGMRSNYVFSLMAYRSNATLLRIGTMSLQPDGSMSQQAWEWNQAWAPAKRDVSKYRVDTGYSSSGCGPTPCPIWTATGFNGAGTTRVGVWKLTHGGARLQINFGPSYEIYALTNLATYTQLTLVSANYRGYSRFFGAAFGSKASLTQGSTLDQIRAVGSPTKNGLKYQLVTANWGMPIARLNSIQWWNSPTNYVQCSPTCMKGARPGSWHSYLVADPPNLGRKMYWYHMLPSVARSTTCANPAYGGHTLQMLQILDDNGTFIGMLGGEASVMARYPGGSIMSYYVGLPIV